MIWIQIYFKMHDALLDPNGFPHSYVSLSDTILSRKQSRLSSRWIWQPRSSAR